MTRVRRRVIACVVERDNRFLICQRPEHKRHAGLWEFPGGKTHDGESDRDAAHREMQEELGVRVVSASPALYERDDVGSDFVIAFVPVVIDGDPQKIEHAAIKWAEMRELVTLPLAPCDRAFVEFLCTAELPRLSGRNG